jgi:prepilin peptidase CpaA
VFYTISALTLLGSGASAVYDLKTNRIPNLLTLPLILIGLILNTYSRGYLGLKDSFLGMAIITLILLLPFALGGIGAGDVKLLAAIGALNGIWFGIYALLLSSIVGGLIALGLAVYQGQLRLTIFNLASSLFSLRANIFKGKIPQSEDVLITGLKFPYGLAIFLGTLTTYIIR